MYLDFGLEITHPNAEEDLFYSPSCLSAESYGFSPPEGFDIEDGESGKVEPVPWGEKEWKLCLRDEANELLEAYIALETLTELEG